MAFLVLGIKQYRSIVGGCSTDPFALGRSAERPELLNGSAEGQSMFAARIVDEELNSGLATTR